MHKQLLFDKQGKKASAWLILAIFIVLVLSLFAVFKESKEEKAAYINGYKFIVEVADTPQKRSIGLSEKKELGKSQGMLFLFDQKRTYHFWMKDMSFPIDIIWISQDTIVDITENVPVPDTEDDNLLPRYSPKSPVDRVLEVNAGLVEKLEIKVGDKITFDQ